MRYCLRTLMILLAVLPPVVWIATANWFAAAAVSVFSAFVLLDVALKARTQRTATWRLVTLKTSHYFTAFAYSMFACGIVCIFIAPDPAPAKGYFSQLEHDIAMGFRGLDFLLLGAVVSMIATMAAFTVVSQSRWALGLLIVNLPWDFLLAYGLIADWLE